MSSYLKIEFHLMPENLFLLVRVFFVWTNYFDFCTVSCVTCQPECSRTKKYFLVNQIYSKSIFSCAHPSAFLCCFVKHVYYLFYLHCSCLFVLFSVFLKGIFYNIFFFNFFASFAYMFNVFVSFFCVLKMFFLYFFVFFCVLVLVCNFQKGNVYEHIICWWYMRCSVKLYFILFLHMF